MSPQRAGHRTCAAERSAASGWASAHRTRIGSGSGTGSLAVTTGVCGGGAAKSVQAKIARGVSVAGVVTGLWLEEWLAAKGDIRPGTQHAAADAADAAAALVPRAVGTGVVTPSSRQSADAQPEREKRRSKSGPPGGRTQNPRIKSPLLCQLS